MRDIGTPACRPMRFVTGLVAEALSARLRGSVPRGRAVEEDEVSLSLRLEGG